MEKTNGGNLIQIKNLVATVNLNNGDTLVTVNKANMELKRGNSYAIVGKSGSGKTSLISIIGLLNHSYQGEFLYNGMSVSTLTDSQLSMLRASNIGFVFQNYSLIKHLRVWENIELPLLYSKKKMNTRQRKEAIRNLLQSVGLEGKENDYPSNLSGGEQQRVAIARALANNPKILLCDEATSALDPQTTASILELLKHINEEFGITIVIITHQMSVIREICNRVAIIERGALVENGLVEDIFSHPKSRAARELILKDSPETGIRREGRTAALMDRIQGDRKLRIVFSGQSAFEPVIANMILKFGTPVNIWRADTKNVGGVEKGEMILGLPDDRHLQVDMEQYLTEHGLAVEEVTDDVE